MKNRLEIQEHRDGRFAIVIAEAGRLCAVAEEQAKLATDADVRTMAGGAVYIAKARVYWPALAKLTRALLAENARLRRVIDNAGLDWAVEDERVRDEGAGHDDFVE